MKVKKHKGHDERVVLIGMIVSDVVVGRIAPKWNKEEGLFKSKWANLIARWCIKYYDKYSKAPAESIEAIFRSWSEKGERDEDTVKLVDRFLSSLSDEYAELGDKQNPEYVLDLAGNYFQEVGLVRLSEGIQSDLDLDRRSDAEARLSQYAAIELGVGAGIDVLEDQAAIQAAFENKRVPLFEYSGDLGKFFNGVWERDSFVAFQGSVGVGKSWWLLDVAWMAMRDKKRVAFFEIGDMSESQAMQRFMVRAAKHPLRPCTVNRPVGIEMNGDGVEVEHEKKRFDDELTWRTAVQACERITRGRNDVYLRMSVHPNSSITVDGMRSIIQGWERNEWIPDVVVIDYADLLLPRPGIQDMREKINDSWKSMRRMSQELHCLVVTATQGDADSYSTNLMSRRNFTDTRQKIDQVTAMIGINRTSSDEEQGVYRLNLLKLRDGEFRSYRCVYTAECLSLGRPVVKSIFQRSVKDVGADSEEE